jgi:hypothetical protein
MGIYGSGGLMGDRQEEREGCSCVFFAGEGDLLAGLPNEPIDGAKPP